MAEGYNERDCIRSHIFEFCPVCNNYGRMIRGTKTANGVYLCIKCDRCGAENHGWGRSVLKAEENAYIAGRVMAGKRGVEG